MQTCIWEAAWYLIPARSIRGEHARCLAVHISDMLVPRELSGSVGGVCNFLGSVSSQQKVEATDGQCYSSVLQLSLFRKQRKIHPGGMKVGWPKRCEEKGNPWPNFGSSFYMSFPPLGLPYVNWASQECCLFYLRSSLWSSDLPLFYFRGLFPSLSFSHPHSGLFFPYSNYLTVGREALIINNRTDSFPLKGRSGGTVRFYLSYWFSGH